MSERNLLLITTGIYIQKLRIYENPTRRRKPECGRNQQLIHISGILLKPSTDIF
jgi:hypothetical protein